MHDAVTVTLIILIAALLRRSLLTNPSADGGTREGEEEKVFMAPALTPVRVERPHTTRRVRHR